MKIILKRIVVLLAILILLFSINSKVFGWSEIIQGGKDFIGAARSSDASIDTSQLQGLSKDLYNILLGAGVAIAVIIAGILGIQFMIGGAEGQAKVKEMILPFVIGCIVVFGGFAIWKIAVDIGAQVEGTGGSGTVVTTPPATPSETPSDRPTGDSGGSGGTVDRPTGDSGGNGGTVGPSSETYEGRPTGGSSSSGTF